MSQTGYSQFTPIISSWQRILKFALGGLFLALVLSLTQPLEYSASTKIAITQELGNVDSYTAGRSAERVADDLAQAMYYSVFFNAIVDQYPDVDESYFGDTVRKQRKKWQDAVSASVSRGNGTLTIRTYHPNSEQAELLAGAIAEYLETDGWRYASGTGSISNMRVVDEVLTSRFPVRPNIPLNMFSGFVVGALFGVGLVLIQTEHLRRKHQVIFEED